MNLFWEIVWTVLASLQLVMARFAVLPLKQPTTPLVWMIKVFTSALSPLLFLLGLLIAVAGWVFEEIPVLLIGGCSAVLYLMHTVQTTRAPAADTALENMPCGNMKNGIWPELKSGFLPRRYVVWLRKPPEPLFEQDIVYYTIAGTGRRLLCDIWQPAKAMKRSGLAFIYLHGSAWTSLDKDFGTRTFFRHLAAQGHVIMDVAYRLFPETDFMGMVHDTKQAVAWMKARALAFQINPDQIVIGGGSAGAHLALLAAYTASRKELTPPDREQADLRVHGVVSLYGQSDLVATYYHTCQHLTGQSSPHKKNQPDSMPSWIQKRMGKNIHRLGLDKEVAPGQLKPIIGGSPDEKREAYTLYSPITHVHQDCPATLIIHGRQDILAPVKAICRLYARLKNAGVPVAMHLLPQTDHGFDQILPKISPAAHNALFDVERFLAIMAGFKPVNEIKSIVRTEVSPQ